MKQVSSYLGTQPRAQSLRLFGDLRAESWPLSASMNDGGNREDSIG